MVTARQLSIGLAITAAALPAAALAAPKGAAGKPAKRRANAHALLSSRELWATIDVCDPADEANTVGIRGSMPGDGARHDKMYMRFRLQYLNTASKRWLDLSSGASPTYTMVGSGSARQGGHNFKLVPVSGKPPVQLRGVVDFQWRAGKKVIQSAARLTTAGHKSLAGADPPGFSAATCSIG